MSAETALVTPVDITCPSWCVVTSEEHRAELEGWEGRCIHSSTNVVVKDTVGYRGDLANSTSRFFEEDMEVGIGTDTTPDNVDARSATLHLNAHDYMTIQQVLDLAKAITDAVALDRNDGGVEWTAMA